MFTALIQSSSAFTGILIVLAQQNLESDFSHEGKEELMKQIIVYSSNIAETFIAACGQDRSGYAGAELPSRSLLRKVDFLSGLIQKEH